MEIQKIKSKDVGTGLSQVLGVTAGLFIPNGVANVYAKVNDESLITEEQKKKKLVANALMAIGGTLGALALKGNDVLTVGVKALSAGVASASVAGIVKPMLAKKVAETDPNTTAGRLLRGSLGCPDMNTSFYGKTLNRPRLRMPMQIMPTAMVETASTEKDSLSSFRLN